ncbi:fibronectin type III domain-containing protein [Pedobacter endophyticus]|uniref:Fibronectin type-III domain-containing protein n=1 Tax=Pedobacter endophyticus TaxID=2789740 RepID=A0A7S9L0R5_9SPHI|nr:hypothetical protein [Pedobacter endophyticus]QPH40159.1 hypothetical protein IZT61_02440 [Pedobacter endophyticus]
MKQLLNIILTITLLAGVSQLAQSQQIDTALINQPFNDSASVHIALRAMYTGDSVLLRWGPTKAGAWSLLNRTGYIVQRSELNTDSTAAKWINLSPKPLKPRPLDDWKRFDNESSTNDYPLVAAQAIYGKDFGNQPAVSLADKADELTNRFSFTLLAADLSYETAVFAGLGFTDHTAAPGKLYTYRVFAAEQPKNYFPIDTGYVSQQTQKDLNEIKPLWALANEGEHVVTLSWSRAVHQGIYTAFYIERSDDGKSYYRINDKPYLQFDNPALEADNENFTFADSLSKNYVPHWYRLVGINNFGQLSQPSPAVKAMGRDKTPPKQPVNLKTAILKDGSVELTWEADNNDADLAGFLIGRSAENSLTGFKPLVDKQLPKNTRRYVDTAPRTNAPNYYIVAATDTAKNASISMAAHVAFLDSIPPSAPTALKAEIDTLGILKLSWKPSIEKDVKGYIVSYANDSTHFFTSAVKEAIPDSTFTDSLSLSTLTEDIFYRVRAVDHNDNTSKESAILKVKKPDRIPPVAPQFRDFKVEENKVTLMWVPSSSEDVVVHEISRRAEGVEAWEKIASLPVEAIKTQFVDTLFKANTKYAYKIQATDDAGLRSPESAIVNLRTLANLVAKGPSSFTVTRSANGNALIKWTLKESDGVRCVLYRAVNGAAFETLATLSDSGTQYEDKNTEPGKQYEYTCKLFYQDGRVSPFSAIRKVN